MSESLFIKSSTYKTEVIPLVMMLVLLGSNTSQYRANIRVAHPSFLPE